MFLLDEAVGMVIVHDVSSSHISIPQLLIAQ
jgi:hypothetical protein